MPLATGTRLGPYEIQAPLGAGGMGEVYRAKDTRLDRTVAIKVLASHLSSSPELKQRMEREARAISSLNHPNICHLYDIGSQDGTDYLVMEFLEGETLAERLRKGRMTLSETLTIGAGIAEALAVAHKQGIVHRDLKPGNIMLTKAGAKLMDFGLAKATPAGFDGASNAPVLSAALTVSDASPRSPLTAAGTLMGTIQYMSPEQIEGKEADARSDLFALGGVLYEMVTGGRAFGGKSQVSVASAILEKEPEPISSLQPLTPPAFEHVVNTCLAKNPDDRFQTAHDVRLQLKWIGQSGASSVKPAGREPSGRGVGGWIAAGGLVIVLMALVIWRRASKPDERTAYFAAPLPFSAQDLAVSPNGHTIAVVGRESERKSLLWIYEPGSREATSIANTDGANFPFWSPDGRSLGFFAEGRLKRVDIAGGPVQTLSDAQTGRGGTWNKDGVILFTPSGQLGTGLYRIAASGGTATQVTFPDREHGEDSHRWPSFLPDGIHYLYLAMDLSGRKLRSLIYVGSLNSKEKRLITAATANAAYTEPGYLLFYRNQTLFAQRFDAKKFELSGEATPILTDIRYLSRIARAVFASFGSGLLVAQQGSDTGVSQMLWFDRKGRQVGVTSKPGEYGNVSLAPNGKSVAADVMDPDSQNTDVWTYDLATESSKRLTFDPAIDSSPVWSPDSSRIAFCSDRAQRFNLYLKDATGAQEETLIPHEGPDRYPTDWSHDGKYVLYERGTDLWFVTFPSLSSSLFLKGLSTPRAGHFSPDGKWVAYASNESGRWEVYVTSFPEAHGKWQVSNAGGEQPRWRSDGKEFYYLAPDGKIMATPVTAGANFDAGTPVALFQANPRELVATSEQSSYDVSKDGEKFLINTQLKTAMTPMSIVMNWTAKLGK
ncbi:MAG: protein kinase [Terriglobales bacterium]|jgi:eukaryotic-like serine/threonine-protein kinase